MDGDEDFEAYLARMAKDNDSCLNENVENLGIDAALQQYETSRGPPQDIIKEAISVVSALPTTQASVERLFSALKIVATDRRSRMKDDVINGILFLKCNKLL